LIIPPSFINIGKSFKSHPNTHVYSKKIVVSSMCFQTRNRLLDLELKYYKTNISVIWMKGKMRGVTHYTRDTACNQTSFISLPTKFQ
jgi:hypothetical protein